MRLHRTIIGLLATLTVGLLLASCAQHQRWRTDPPPTQPVDQQPLSDLPEERDPSLFWDAINQSTFYLIERSLDLPRQYRKLTGQLKEAYNADVFGEVPDCSWFTNRHGQTRMSPDAIRRGPNSIEGPDTTGTWLITRAKTEGVTPGFFVKDQTGETFVLKFDPVENPELATGAEMVCTKFFHAVGYNVPENYLISFDPKRLVIKEGITFADRFGNKEPFTREVLDNVLDRVARRPDGRIRAIASRFLPGKPIGPFSYRGRRNDDPNDHIPHQHRRELRGLKVFAQLVNHFDTKDHNTLDILVEEDGATYVRHYLIDFGSTLGSDGNEPKARFKGYAYVFDLEQAVVSLATLGLRQWSWEDEAATEIPASIGYFESERFHVPGWKPLHGNPAFDNMTHTDAYWAASIVASFSEDDLRACVEAAEYSDPAAAEYLLKTLRERQRKIIDYYYSKVNPLSQFELGIEDYQLALRFVDSWASIDSASDDQVMHRYRFGHQRKSWGRYRTLTAGEAITVDPETILRIDQISEMAEDDQDRVFHVQIQSRRDGKWGHWVRVYFHYLDVPPDARIVGIERDD